MGNSWGSSKRNGSKSWSPHGEYFDQSRKRSSKRWSMRKPKHYRRTISDLDVERGIPAYLHYQSPNSVEEDLFTTDSRIPCVIHLHQRTRQDINHLLRGTSTYAKSRPKSMDPKLLMEKLSLDELDPCSPQSPRNSSFLPSFAHINSKVEQEHDHQSLFDQKMRIDPSSSNTDIIKVDKSGENFERQANLRRSQRLSSCTPVRQRSNASQRRQLRHKHKTLIGLSGNEFSQIAEGILRPCSLHSDVIGHSYIDESSDGSRSVNDQAIVSPRQNLKNAEIQTDDVKVLTLTPSQRRMKQKGIGKNHSSPASSTPSNELIEPSAAVTCSKAHMMKQTSTSINVLQVEEIIRPSTLDVKTNDTSTDEGRHTGESNPSTPIRTGTPQEASPQLKKSPLSNASDSNGNHSNNNNNGKYLSNNIAMRMNGGSEHQGEDRASSGCWSGTESAQHSSSSDITSHHAPVMNALQHMLQKGKQSPVSPNPASQVSPVVANRPLVSNSATSTSPVSVNSKLSTLDVGKSNSSLYRDDDERFQSPNSSVVNVITLSRSNNASTLSLNSTASDGGTAISAAAMMKRSRKARLNGTAGTYSFMNYDVDPLDTGADQISRVVKSRRSTRSVKNRSFKKRMAEDTMSMSSMADSSPQNTDADALSAHSGSRFMDNASLCESMFSVDHEGYYTSMHDDCGISKNAPPCTVSVTSMPETVYAEEKTTNPTPIVIAPPSHAKPASPAEGARDVFVDDVVDARNNNYNSYNRAVKSNHSTPKSLLSPRGKSASVKTPRHVDPPALDFQSELNKRLSVRGPSDKKMVKKAKRGPPPSPPKRASSLSGGSSPSPSASMKSLTEKESPLAVPSRSPGSKLSTPPQKAPLSPEEFYKTTPPPPPPIDALPPPPPELLSPDNKTFSSPETNDRPRAVTNHLQRSETEANAPESPASPASPKSPVTNSAPYQSIAMQAAMLGSRFSQKKKSAASNGSKTEVKEATASECHLPEKLDDSHFEKSPKISSSKPIVTMANTKLHSSAKISPPVAPKTTHIPPVVKSPPPTVVKTTAVPQVAKIPPPVAPKTASVPPTVKSCETTTVPHAAKSPPLTAVKPTAVPQAAKIPPPVAPKTATIPPAVKSLSKTSDEEDATKQTKASTLPPTVAPKPNKIPSITSSPSDENIPVAKNVVEKSSEKIAEKAEIPPKTEETRPQQTVESAANAPETVAKPDDDDKPDSVDWLEKIEEFSGPNHAGQNSNRDVAPEQDSTASNLELHSKPNHRTFDGVMLALQKAKHQSLSEKAATSPPPSPGANNEGFTYKANGSKSPGSTLERKRNGRLSSNGGVRSGISRKSTGGTSRDNFKALLLQNACRGSSGSQMTAAEKLQLNKPSAAAALSQQRTNSVDDADVTPEENQTDSSDRDQESARPILSLSDIRSAITSGSATTSRIGRTSRRGPQSAATDFSKYATLSAQAKKQHPPPSLSSKYNTRSRTPTRPMMSISEDSETEKSPEQALAQSRVNEG